MRAFFATNSLCFISMRSRFWLDSTHPPSAVLEKYGWISHGKVIVNTFRVHRTTRNSIRFTVAGLNIVSPKHWMNNVWTLRKNQWLKIHQKISNHFNAQRYRCKRVKFIQSLRTERTAHISFHLFSHIQFFSSLIPFRWTAYAAINAMWPWHFDHFHPDSICYTGDGNYNHSIDVVHNFSATIHQYMYSICHRHGFKWIFAFRPTLTTFFQSHIFLGSYEPFADNIINIKYCCSHQRKFSIIFQHFQSNGSIAMPWIPNILHFWMAQVLLLWIVLLFIFIFAGHYV